MSWASWESALEDAATNGADKEYAARQKGMDTPMLEARKLGQLIPSSMSNLSLASMVSDVSTSDIETIPIIEEDEREASREAEDQMLPTQRGPAATLPTQNDFLGNGATPGKAEKVASKAGTSAGEAFASKDDIFLEKWFTGYRENYRSWRQGKAKGSSGAFEERVAHRESFAKALTKLQKIAIEGEVEQSDDVRCAGAPAGLPSLETEKSRFYA